MAAGMDLELDGRVVLIAGASGGIGAATARRLAASGARLALLARNRERLATLAASLGTQAGALVLCEDATRPGALDEAVSRTVERFGQLDRLVVAAGPMGRRAPLHLLSDGDWGAYYEQSLMIAVRACRAAIPALLRAGDGALVLTAAYSIRAQKPDLGAYSAMKSAIASVTKNIALTYGAQGLRANCIAPGVIVRDVAPPDSPEASVRACDAHARYEAVRAATGMQVALGRAGRHEEFADAIAFLLSNRASYITGATLNIDGGTNF
jgi:3-oxoacyl-[acyl-carrier protein] reductase